MVDGRLHQQKGPGSGVLRQLTLLLDDICQEMMLLLLKGCESEALTPL